jgi:Fibrinogen beta and gamma chains, C-terminal globular domain
MAQNVTVNVNIPALNITVPVISIYQWLVIMSRIDTNFPLNQTYQVYQDGFGNATSNFWLGLTRIHYLTNSRGYRLRFELLSSGNSKYITNSFIHYEPNCSELNMKVSGLVNASVHPPVKIVFCEN